MVQLLRTGIYGPWTLAISGIILDTLMSKTEQSRAAVFSELNGVMAVATHRNFRAASVELGVSASALSHAVANLERRLGVKLFHRTTRSVSLSQAGEHFLERVQPAMRQIAEAMET